VLGDDAPAIKSKASHQRLRLRGDSLAPVGSNFLGKPDGPILLDCKVNADIAAPFMGEFAEFEARQHG
jgi:hypothetical protein